MNYCSINLIQSIGKVSKLPPTQKEWQRHKKKAAVSKMSSNIGSFGIAVLSMTQRTKKRASKLQYKF